MAAARVVSSKTSQQLFPPLIKAISPRVSELSISTRIDFRFSNSFRYAVFAMDEAEEIFPLNTSEPRRGVRRVVLVVVTEAFADHRQEVSGAITWTK